MGLRDKQKLERRERILAAAQELIRATGSIGLSMRALAEKAEVGLATPYNLFGSKGAVLRKLRIAVLERLQHEMDQLRSDDPLDDLLRIAELGANTYAADPQFHRVLRRALMASDNGIHDGALEAGSVNLWQRPVEEGIRAGLLRADADAELVARDLVIVYLGVLDLWVREVLDGEGLRTHLLYAFTLTLLGLATDASRPKLLGHYHRLQRQLPRKIRAAETGSADKESRANGKRANGRMDGHERPSRAGVPIDSEIAG
jgi:AcrR family transcriptional regulator